MQICQDGKYKRMRKRSNGLGVNNKNEEFSLQYKRGLLTIGKFWTDIKADMKRWIFGSIVFQRKSQND